MRNATVGSTGLWSVAPTVTVAEPIVNESPGLTTTVVTDGASVRSS